MASETSSTKINNGEISEITEMFIKLIKRMDEDRCKLANILTDEDEITDSSIKLKKIQLYLLQRPVPKEKNENVSGDILDTQDRMLFGVYLTLIMKHQKLIDSIADIVRSSELNDEDKMDTICKILI